MLNKKGTSLAEVIISIALISVVLIFMIRLLIDLNNLETNTTYARDNQINRAEILRTIGNDLNNKVLTSIVDNSDLETLNITFNFSDNTSSYLSTTSTLFSYIDSTGENVRRWEIAESSVYVNRANVYYSADDKIFTLIIDIEVHTINEENDAANNNTLDDIMINYLGNVSDFTTPLTCLGTGCNQ